MTTRILLAALCLLALAKAVHQDPLPRFDTGGPPERCWWATPFVFGARSGLD